ncbi:MAG: PIN domain nuclease [Wenzhouxiangella sp.]|jgi:predicted nucleic acid-binding protein|nr:PIN domain nuclease [Wenzhouxiangella sp.]
MTLVDSSVWIDYFRGVPSPQTDWLDSKLGQQPILIGDLILAEVLQGFRRQRDFDRARQLLSAFETVRLCSPDLAIKAADHFRTLRARGVTVRKTIDTLIATWCIETGCELLHKDRDFEAFERHLGLRVVC